MFSTARQPPAVRRGSVGLDRKAKLVLPGVGCCEAPTAFFGTALVDDAVVVIKGLDDGEFGYGFRVQDVGVCVWVIRFGCVMAWASKKRIEKRELASKRGIWRRGGMERGQQLTNDQRVLWHVFVKAFRLLVLHVKVDGVGGTAQVKESHQDQRK